MPVIPAEADIRCPAEQIFDLITDFRGQERWLAKSSAFRGTTEISAASSAGMTHVARVVTLTVPPSLRLVQPVLVRAFRTESARTSERSRPTPTRWPYCRNSAGINSHEGASGG
jgi:hypothetical protein